MSITHFRFIADGINKTIESEDYFNFTLPHINTSGIQAIKILDASIPWSWPNIRPGINDTLNIKIYIESTYQTFNLSYKLSSGLLFLNLSNIKKFLQNHFNLETQTQLVAQGWLGGPINFDFLVRVDYDSQPIILRLAARTVWGGIVEDITSTIKPRIVSMSGMLSQMLGFNYDTKFKHDNPGTLAITNYHQEVTGNSYPHIIPTKVVIKSRFISRYIERGSHIVNEDIYTISMAEDSFNSLIKDHNPIFFNFNPVGGQGTFMDFSCRDDFGPIQSFNPFNRLQLTLEFYEDAREKHA